MNFCSVWTSSSKTEHRSISGPAELTNAGWLTPGLGSGERFSTGEDIGRLGEGGPGVDLPQVKGWLTQGLTCADINTGVCSLAPLEIRKNVYSDVYRS